MISQYQFHIQGIPAFRDFTIRDPRYFVILFEAKGGGGCSFGFGFQEPFNGDAISGLVNKSKSDLFLRISQLKRSGSALNCG